MQNSSVPSRKPTPVHLAAAIAVALAAWTGSAGAAGLGRLSVNSALGQPLQAEVEVTSVNGDEAASLAAKLASPEAFRAAGLQYNNSLAGLRMVVQERGGRHFIKVTSSRPINEPFVDLMVELNWASGKFVREYTFLLDPPELRASRQTVEGGSAAGAPVAPAVSARATPQPPRSVAESSRPDAPQPSAAQRAEAVRAEAVGRASVAAPAASASATASRAQPAASSGSGATSDTVTVARGDTLGKIAAANQPSSATLEQTIVAIYQSNKSAFIDNNPNLIRQGRTLTIPDAAAIAAVDASSAQRQLRVAARDFQAYKNRLAGAVTEVASAGTGGTTASGSVSAQVEDSATKGAVADRLELSKSTAAASGQAGAVGTRDAEAKIARDAALVESNSRIADLERSVADLQKMVELKNKSLSDLQAQLDLRRATGAAVSGSVAAAGANALARTPAQTPATVAAAADTAGSTSPSSTSANPSAVDSASSSARPGADPSASPRSEPSSSSSTNPSDTAATPATPAIAPTTTGDSAAPSSASSDPSSSSTSSSDAANSDAVTSAAVAAEASRSPAPASPAAAAPMSTPVEESVFDGLIDNPMLLPGLGGLALLGGFGLWMALRRRKVDRFEDSLIAADAFTANSLFGTTGGHSVDTTSGTTQTQVTTMNEASPTEVDPIAEADVYIAYGREAQAEEILKEALKRQQDRQAIRLKLMEIYSGRKDAQSFETMAREMHVMTGGQNEEWPKVATMGLALDPHNALYTGGSVAAASTSSFGRATAVTSAAAASAAAAVGSLAAHDDPFEAERSDTLTGQTSTFMGQQARYGASHTQSRVEPVDTAIADLDFNLDLDRSLETTTAKVDTQFGESAEFLQARSGPLSAMPSVDLPSLDLDTPTLPPSRLDDAEDFALDLDTGSLDGLQTRSGPGTAASQESAMDLSAIGLDLAPTTQSESISVSSGAGSGQWQEMASKLDLASAYGEIGDKEGARELLQEVVRGGDASQQQKARELLASI